MNMIMYRGYIYELRQVHGDIFAHASSNLQLVGGRHGSCASERAGSQRLHAVGHGAGGGNHDHDMQWWPAVGARQSRLHFGLHRRYGVSEWGDIDSATLAGGPVADGSLTCSWLGAATGTVGVDSAVAVLSPWLIA